MAHKLIIFIRISSRTVLLTFSAPERSGFIVIGGRIRKADTCRHLACTQRSTETTFGSASVGSGHVKCDSIPGELVPDHTWWRSPTRVATLTLDVIKERTTRTPRQRRHLHNRLLNTGTALNYCSGTLFQICPDSISAHNTERESEKLS